MRKRFDVLSRKRSGSSFAIHRQRACANAFASFQLTLSFDLDRSGTTTCKPLPPVVLAEPFHADVLEALPHFPGGMDHFGKN